MPRDYGSSRAPDGADPFADLPGSDAADFPTAEPPEYMDEASAAPWPALDLVACSLSSAPEREWMVDGWMPLHNATLLTGTGGVGKSLLAQLAATCVALGRPFLGLETRQASAAYMSWEDDRDELWRRQEAMCAHLGVPIDSLAGKLELVSWSEAVEPFVLTVTTEGPLALTKLGRAIVDKLDSADTRFIVFDNASQIAAIDHNELREVAPFAHWANALAQRRSGAVLLLHHPNKAGEDWLGSVAYTNQFRSRILMSRPDNCPDPDMRLLTNPKANYARAGASITFRWHRGCFVLDGDLPDEQRGELEATARAVADNSAFLACLDERMRQRRAVSENKASRTYAPKEFAEMPESLGIGKQRLEAAMDRLFRIQAIERGFLWRDSDEGKDRSGLRRVSADSADPTADPTADLPPTLRRHTADPTADSAHTHPYTTYKRARPEGAAAPSYAPASKGPCEAAARMILAPGETGDFMEL